MFRFTSLFAITATSLLLTACSGGTWTHPTKSSGEFAADYNQCNNDAQRDPKLQQGMQIMVIRATERCVQKMGWYLKED
jgi:major membrane immunogen (membrane-anchored lipoprotein)